MRLDTLMFFYFIPWLSFPRFLLFWLLYLWSFLWMKAYAQRLFLVFDKTDWATHGFRWSRDVNEMYALFFRIFCSFFNIRKQRSLHAKSSSSKTGSVLGLRLNKSDKCKNSGGRDWSLPSSCCRLCIGEENRAAAGSRGNRELEKERLYGESFRGEPKKKKVERAKEFFRGKRAIFFQSLGCHIFITGLLISFHHRTAILFHHRATDFSLSPGCSSTIASTPCHSWFFSIRRRTNCTPHFFSTFTAIRYVSCFFYIYMHRVSATVKARSIFPSRIIIIIG